MAITIDIATTDRTGVLVANKIRIRRQLNGRASADIVLQSDSYSPTVGQDLVVEEGGTKRFAGFIHEARKFVHPGTSTLQWALRCLDYSHIADRRICTDDFLIEGGWTHGGVVTQLVNRFLTGEGITTTNVVDASALGVDLPFKNRPVAECLNRVSVLTGLPWFVDFDKDLNYKDFSATTAPFGLTNTSANWAKLNVRQSLDQYRNVQYVQTEHAIEVAQADEWQMRPAVDNTFWYPTSNAISETPIVKVNDVSKTVGILTLDTGFLQPFPGTHDFYFIPGLFGVYVDDVSLYDTTDTIAIEYGSELAHSVVRIDQTEIDARAAIEGGSGRHEAVEDQKDINTVGALQAYGDGLLRRFAALPTSIEFETFTSGLEPGQNISIVYAPLGLNASYFIESVGYELETRDMASLDRFKHRIKCSDQEVFGRPTGFFDRVISMARVSVSGAVSAAVAPPAGIPTCAEVPLGTIDGTNAIFNLADKPTTPGSLLLVVNGVVQFNGTDYGLKAKKITYDVALAAADWHAAWYGFGWDNESEIPGGTKDGANTTFTLSASPAPTDVLLLVMNGVVQEEGTASPVAGDFTLSGGTIEFNFAPISTDNLRAWYKTADDGILSAETPTGTINGSNKVFTLSKTPSCMFLMLNGVVQTLARDFKISGSTITYNDAPATGAWHKVFIV